MLLILYVLDSLFFATPKSKRVLTHVWRHMPLTLWFVDSLFFATPKTKRVLMGTKVGGEVHGEGQRKRKGVRRRAWHVRKLFFSFYALLATRFSLPIRHPPTTPTSRSAGSQERTLWGRCWLPTLTRTAPGTHGQQVLAARPQKRAAGCNTTDHGPKSCFH